MTDMGMDSETPVYDQMLRELAAFPVGWLGDVHKGDTFTWQGSVEITVTRVAADGSWADLHCVRHGTSWTKRQVLPLPQPANAQDSPVPRESTEEPESADGSDD